MADEQADEQAPTSAGASAISPSAAPGDTLPFPFWALFGMGALNCVTWVVATLLDLWTPKSSLAPMWLWNGLHVALVLAVPALILLFVRSSRMPPRRHPRVFFMVAALLALIAALPTLLPVAAPPSPAFISLPLRVPTLSLGVALAAVDPLVIERWRRSDPHDPSTATAAGVGFGVVAFVALIIGYSADSLHRLQYLQCTGVDRMWCGHLVGVTMFGVCGGGWLLALPGLFGALLGYAIGAWVARSDYWL